VKKRSERTNLGLRQPFLVNAHRCPVRAVKERGKDDRSSSEPRSAVPDKSHLKTVPPIPLRVPHPVTTVR